MPTVTLVRGLDGRLAGLTERDVRAFSKWRTRVETLEPAECVSFTWREPRSGPHHRRFFAVLGALHDAQEAFEDPDDLRLWLECGAGHCTFAPGPDGQMVALPKSIAWDRLDQVEFQEVETRVLTFLRSERATRHLWPHLSDPDGLAMVEAVLKEFE